MDITHSNNENNTNNNKKVVVTGGLGFIGSHFIREMLLPKEGTGVDNSVINVDFMGYGSNVNNLKDIITTQAIKNKRYIHIKADICSTQSLEESLAHIKDIDVIVNFAAETHVDRSISNPTAFVDSNVNGVVSLLEFCRLHEVPLFVQISTDEVYGDAAVVVEEQGHEGAGEEKKEGIHFDEDSPLKPNSPYSASKASADLLTRAYNKTYGLKTIITRCSNNFGPNQFPEKLIPKSVISALKGLAIPIYGDGRQKREWIYVNDHVDAILKVITDGKSGEIYNISSSSQISNIELVCEIRDILYSVKPDIKKAGVKYVGDRPGHDRCYSLDCSKIKRELGWKPRYSFDFAIEQTIKWYTNNEWWWTPLLTDNVLDPQPWGIEWKKR
jgi:dTDP-glucose 4,6-dehydratase